MDLLDTRYDDYSSKKQEFRRIKFQEKRGVGVEKTWKIVFLALCT